MRKLWGKIKESWEDFLFRQHEESALSALEDLVSDDEAMEKMAKGETELPWQPWVISPPQTEPAKREQDSCL